MSRSGLLALTLGASSLLAAPAIGQNGPHVFQIVPSASQFNFSGTATLPGIGTVPIQGNPSSFRVSGTADMDMDFGTQIAGRFVDRGSVVDFPTLNAQIPNFLPFLPPLATIQVTGLRMVFTSVDPNTLLPASFTIAGGVFSTSVVTTALSGTATIDVLGSGTSTIDLAGLVSPAQAITGSIVVRADGLRLDVPLALAFDFVDPGGSGSGQLNLNGRVLADDLPFAGDISTLSLAAGATQTLRLSAGSGQAGTSYLVLTSITGTTPGLNVNGVNLPLNPDGLLVTSALSANTFPWTNTANDLNGIGIGTASFTLPGGLFPALNGFTLNHAYLLLNNNSRAVFASNPVPLALTP